MQTLRLLYKSQKSFTQLIEGSSLDLNRDLLVRIHSAVLTPEAALTVSREIAKILPTAKIIGSSGSGIIFERKQFDNETLVIIEQFANIQVATFTNTFQNKTPHELAREVAEISGTQTPLIHILFGGRYLEIQEFLTEFNALNSPTKLTGGIVGDIITQNIPAYVFTPDGLIENGIVIAAYQGTKLHTYTTANIAHEPISPVYTVNKMQGTYFLEIENRPALEWFSEHLGLKVFKEYSNWQLLAENDDLVKFPIILENQGGASRFIKYDAKENKMSIYASHLTDNTKFRLGYSSPIKCIQECADICNQIVSRPMESIFCYPCLFRRMYFENCAEWELRPFSHIGICGVFMMGEIAYLDGKNQLLNGSCSIVGLAENEKYIEPDFSVFEDLYKIKNDNDQLLNFILKKQSSAMSKENKALMEKLVEQQQKFRDQLYIDNNTGLKNSICFTQDNMSNQFNKICMIRVENFDLLFTRLGQHGYYRFIKKMAQLFLELINSLHNREHLHFYVLNDSTMFIVANNSLGELSFIEAASKLFDGLQFVKPDCEQEMLINRFVIVVNQKELLEQGLIALENSKNQQTHFIIANSSTPSSSFLNGEMEMLHILNQAIKTKNIIPYFQGIYDNSKQQILFYEALMRIQDTITGTIYAPNAFMDIAKKYHLYAKLSSCMIDKVFELFAGRSESVSINLSVHDIKLQEMQETIIQNLQKVATASNFTFEILEDEEFRHVDNLKEFVALVRTYGAKIAIDDFGSGYSNFMKLVMLEPDYIKIDGEIVKGIESSPLNRKVLANIVFLGKQLNASLVAEFVENEHIQKHVEQLGINFSQGYYFARPVPYNELQLSPTKSKPIN